MTEIAEAYADLANRYEADHPRRVELLASASTMWSLAGYQANASTLAAAFTREVHSLFARGELEDFESPTTTAPYRIAALTGAVLRRDLDEVSRLGAQTAEELPTLGQRLVGETSEGRAGVADAAVLAAYGLAGRAARNLAALWRSGNRTAGRAAVTDLRKAASVLLDASVADTWTLIDSLAHVVEPGSHAHALRSRASTPGGGYQTDIGLPSGKRRPFSSLISFVIGASSPAREGATGNQSGEPTPLDSPRLTATPSGRNCR